MGLTARIVALVAVGFALAVLPATHAAAQSSEMRQMLKRVERMQRELSTLQQHVYKGTRPPAPAPGTPQSFSGGANPRTVARLEVRLTQLENELRAMTGRIEEVQHGVTTIGKRLDKLVSDVDFRLAALERKSSAAAQPEATQPTPQQQQQTASAAPRAAAPSAAARGTRAIPPRNLGNIPKSALASRPQTVKPAVAAKGGSAKPPAGATLTPRQQYSAAIRLLQAQRFSDAERALRSFIKSNPKHALQANAHYWLGETFYVRRDYQRAAYTFADSFQKYPEGNKAADNLLKLGMSLGKLGKKKEACTTYSRLLENFPKASSTLKGRVARQRRSIGCG